MTYPHISDFNAKLADNTSSGYRAEKCIGKVNEKPVTMVNSFPSKERAEEWCKGSIAVEVKAPVVPTQTSFLHPG